MIFEQDLKKERQQKWNVADSARPLRTLDDGREFLNGVGFCLAYPVRSLPAPTFIGAYNGSEENLPSAKQAFEDENAQAATELIVRLLKEKAAFEVAFGEDASLLVSAAEFPYFYALVGDRNPKVAPSPGPRGEQALTTHTFEIIDEHGPISEDEMRRKLGREISRNAIEKVLHTLWSKLRIVRVDEGLENGEPVEPVWDMMHRFAPEQINRGKQISAVEALSALISKYLETVISAEQKDVEEFFSRLVPRSRVTEVCKAMLGAQEFTFVQVSGKTMLRLASRGGDAEHVPVTEHKARPWQAREEGKRAEEEKRAKFAERPPKRDATQPGGAFQKFSKDKGRKPFTERKPFGDNKEFGERKPFGERKEFGARGPKKFGERKPFSRDSKPFGDRKSFSPRPAFGKDRPSFGKDRPPRPEGDRPAFKKSFGERKPFSRDRKPFGERKSFGDRPKSFGPRKSFSESGKSFADRKAGARSGAPGGDRPFKKPFGDRKPFGDKRSFGDRKPFGERKSFGDRPPKKNFGDYPPRERSEGAESKKPFAGKKSLGDKKPFGAKKSFGGPRSFGAKKAFGGPKSFGGKKPFGKPFAKRKPAGDRPPAKRREEPSE